MRETLNKIKVSVISGVLVGFVTCFVAYGFNSNLASKNELKIALDKKASIEWVNQRFEDHKEISKSELEYIKSMQSQLNVIYALLLKHDKGD